MEQRGPEGANDYRLRLADAWLDEYLPKLSAFLLVGPRAAGKTTTAVRRSKTVVRLDRPAESAAFAADPDAALRGLSEPVLLDEWQVVPEVLGALKRSVDLNPSPNRFLVTGSVRAALAAETWPGTGRLTRYVVYPMTIREQIGRLDGSTLVDKLLAGDPLSVRGEAPDLRDYVGLALRGGFPYPALDLDVGARALWMESYISDLVGRDIPAMESSATRTRDPARLQRYFEAYALNSAGTVADKTIYESAGVDRRTSVAYEALLEDLFVVERVPAWRTKRLGRLVSQPKRYVVDPALLAAAVGADLDGIMRDGNLLGRMLDTLVASQIRPELATSAGRPRLHHLRTKGGAREVDIVLELAGGRMIGIEVKATAAPRKGDASHLRWLRDEMGDRFAAGVVFHTGPRTFELDRAITAAPIAALWS